MYQFGKHIEAVEKKVRVYLIAQRFVLAGYMGFLQPFAVYRRLAPVDQEHTGMQQQRNNTGDDDGDDQGLPIAAAGKLFLVMPLYGFNNNNVNNDCIHHHSNDTDRNVEAWLFYPTDIR